MATSQIFPGQFPSTLGQTYGYDNVVPPFYLNGAVLTAAAATFPALTIPAFNTLTVIVNMPSIGGSDSPVLRFNADAGANYCSRSLVIAASPATTYTEAHNDVSAAFIRLGAASTLGRIATCTINNALAQPKIVSSQLVIAVASAATSMPTQTYSGGVWFNTAAQITSITCLSAAGQLMGIGSSIQIFGGY